MALNITNSGPAAGGDYRWLYSRHAVENAGTITLDISAFTLDEGVVKSGTPIAEDDSTGLAVPFTDDDTQDLAGFVLNDMSGDFDRPAAYVWHGRIRTEFLPVDGFTPPSGTGFIFD